MSAPKPAVIRKSRKAAAPKKREGRVVAVRRWSPFKDAKSGHLHFIASWSHCEFRYPVFVLPADAASVERMVEQDARAMMKLLGSWEDTTESHRNQMRALARAALASKDIKAKGGRHG